MCQPKISINTHFNSKFAYKLKQLFWALNNAAQFLNNFTCNTIFEIFLIEMKAFLFLSFNFILSVSHKHKCTYIHTCNCTEKRKIEANQLAEKKLRKKKEVFKV